MRKESEIFAKVPECDKVINFWAHEQRNGLGEEIIHLRNEGRVEFISCPRGDGSISTREMKTIRDSSFAFRTEIRSPATRRSLFGSIIASRAGVCPKNGNNVSHRRIGNCEKYSPEDEHGRQVVHLLSSFGFHINCSYLLNSSS